MDTAGRQRETEARPHEHTPKPPNREPWTKNPLFLEVEGRERREGKCSDFLAITTHPVLNPQSRTHPSVVSTSNRKEVSRDKKR